MTSRTLFQRRASLQGTGNILSKDCSSSMKPGRRSSRNGGQSILPNGATGCFIAWRGFGRTIRRKASPLRLGSRPPRPPSQRSSRASLASRRAWSCCQGFGLKTFSRPLNGMRLGRTKTGNGRRPIPNPIQSSSARARALANAMTAPLHSHKWEKLAPAERRLSGIRFAELPDPAGEAQAIALILREALETPGKTAALITPDRQLAARVSALLERWGIEADDSAGKPLSETPPATLLLGIASAAAEDLAPVALLALLKHPLVGGEGDERVAWLDAVRELDLKLRGPRPAAGISGLDAHFGSMREWQNVRPYIEAIVGLLRVPISLARFVSTLSNAAQTLAGDSSWRGPAGRMAAKLLADIQAFDAAQQLE